jgi:hypothetical protein
MPEETILKEKKFHTIAYLLWGLGFVGICGMQRMYLGQYGLGTAMLLTFGFCGFGQLVDAVVIPQAIKKLNISDSEKTKSARGIPDQLPNYKINKSAEGIKTASILDELDMEQASIEETMKKLRK